MDSSSAASNASIDIAGLSKSVNKDQHEPEVSHAQAVPENPNEPVQKAEESASNRTFSDDEDTAYGRVVAGLQAAVPITKPVPAPPIAQTLSSADEEGKAPSSPSATDEDAELPLPKLPDRSSAPEVQSKSSSDASMRRNRMVRK